MSIPPRGHGIYGRGQSPEYLRGFTFVVQMSMASGAVGQLRSDLPRRVAVLKAAGRGVYLSGGPAHWTPDTYLITAPVLERAARDLGADGIVADPEAGWASASPAHVTGLARVLQHVRRAGLSVGVTSIPLWPRRALLAHQLEGAAWGSPQVYLPDAAAHRPPAREVLAQWRELFGAAVPSVALWAGPGDELTSPELYAAYLRQLPQTSAGAIGWPLVSEPEPWRTAAYRAWGPGMPLLHALRDIASSRAVMIGAAVLVVAVLVGLAYAGGRS